MNHEHRDEVKRELDAAVRQAGREKRLSEAQSAYRDLRELRNALAHGSRSAFGDIQRVVASETELRTFLTGLLQSVRKLQQTSQ